MNTVLSTRVDEQNVKHLPHQTHTVRRVGLADRVALHLGLALVTWSRRPRTLAPTRQRDERLVRRNELARAERERQWTLLLQLGLPRR